MREAERSEDFDKDLIELARVVTEKAGVEVRRMENEEALQPGDQDGKSRDEQVHADDL